MFKNKLKIAGLLLTLLLIVQFTSTIFHQNEIFQSSKEDEDYINNLEEITTPFLQLNQVLEESYIFSAFGHCIIGIEVKDTDFTHISLNNEEIEVSYGYNVFFKDFGELKNHQISVDNPSYISHLYIQPLNITEKREVTLNKCETYQFDAGGLICLLIRPLDFSYNDLFIQIDNITLKHVYSEDDVPFNFDYIIFHPLNYRYYQFHLDLNPGTHELQLNGTGTAEFLLVSEEDYDEDGIRNSEEIQLSDIFDPVFPNLWGCYESGYKSGTDAEEIECLLNIFIPDMAGSELLYIEVVEGEVSKLSVDDNSSSFQDIVFTGSVFLLQISPGFHQIIYSVSGEEYEVDFEINFHTIPIIDYFELRDSDGDSIKDVDELRSGLDPDNLDTDLDGQPDAYDLSPLHHLNLNPKEIGQIIIPTEPETSTIISMQIKSPTQNHMGKVLWRNELECTIIPGLRIFGNPTIDRQTLLNSYHYLLKDGTYEKESIVTYNLLDWYDPSGNGDYIPDSNDPSTSFTFIPLQTAEDSFDCDIVYESNHPAKINDIESLIDFRFDFIWIILYKNETDHQNILHFYPIEEPITIQSMKVQEISDIDYVLATPDNPVEHIIFKSIMENPFLTSQSGLFSENFQTFSIQDDIISQGSTTYTSFLKDIVNDYEDKALQNNQNEVLYVAGSSRSLDIFNEIRNQDSNNQLNDIEKTQGTYLSKFTIFSDVKSQNFGDNYKNIEMEFFSPASASTKKVLLGKVINLELIDFPADTQGILISRAYGGPIDVDVHVIDDVNLESHLKIEYNLWIDRGASLSSGIAFGEEDINKLYYDNRQSKINLDSQLFEPHSPSDLADFFQFLFDNVNSLDNLEGALLDMVDWCGPNPTGQYDFFATQFTNFLDDAADIKGFMKKMVEGGSLSLDDASNLRYKIEQWVKECTKAVDDFDETFKNNFDYDQIKSQVDSAKGENKKLNEEFKKLKTKSGEIGNNNNGFEYDPDCTTPDRRRTQKFSIGKVLRQNAYKIIGGALIALGGIIIVCGIINMINLIGDQIKGTGTTNTVEFVLKLTQSLATIALGIVVVKMGTLILQLEKAAGTALEQTITKSMSFLGKICVVLTILISAIEIGMLISQAISGEIAWSDAINAILTFAISLTISVALSVALPAILGVTGALATTGVGLVVAGIMLLLTLLGGWLTDLCNDPNIGPVEGGISLILPEENMTRRGGLTVGDTIGMNITVGNTGDNAASFYTRIRTDDDWGTPNITKGCDFGPIAGVKWWEDGPYLLQGAQQSLTVYDTLTRPTPNQEIDLFYSARAVMLVFHVIIPWYENPVIAEGTESIPLNLPVCDLSFSHFYDDTIPLTVEGLAQIGSIEKLLEAIEEYRYKDAHEIKDTIQSISEEEAQITFSDFNDIQERTESYDSEYDILHIQEAKYSFDEDIGGDPSNWTVTETDKTHCGVIQSKAGHESVVEFWDDDPRHYLETGVAKMTQTIDKEKGAVEFWFYYEDGQLIIPPPYMHNFYIIFGDIDDWFFDLTILGTLTELRTNNVIIDTDFQPNEWHHLRIEFDCGVNKFKVWSNQTYKGEYNFKKGATSISELHFTTGMATTAVDAYFWLDSVDYSWSPGYFPYRSYYHKKEFVHLILNYYPNMIARTPLNSGGEIEEHLGAFAQSGGNLLISKNWTNKVNETFEILREALRIVQDLPLATNIELNQINISAIDPITKTLNKSLQFNLEGPDDPFVKLEIDEPSGFSITIDQEEGYLSQGFNLTITQTDLSLLAGLYDFHIRIIYEGEVIFEGDPAVRLPPYSDLKAIEHEIPAVIEPGESYPIITLENYGNVPEGCSIAIEESIPESLLQYFIIQAPIIMPTESIDVIELQIPRHYSVMPGESYFEGIVEDLLTHIQFEFNNTFTMAEFYDFEFNCVDPDISIFDGETGAYTFDLINLGNVLQTFDISYDDVTITAEELEKDNIPLSPGEADSFSLTLIPTGLGTETFTVYASSEYNSDIISATIDIIDDDTTPPTISVSYIGEGNDGVPGAFYWEIFDEDDGIGGDGDIGLSEIVVTVEFTPDEGPTQFIEVVNPQPVDSWAIPNNLGTYEITIFARDNDDDRSLASDSLSNESSLSQTIIDDDTTPPTISISYIGESTDGVPGAFYWEIFDEDDGIGGDGDTGLSDIAIAVLYFSSSGGLPDIIKVEDPHAVGSWAIPNQIGLYFISIMAQDNDDDRTLLLDSLTSTAGLPQIILDDDVVPPVVSDVVIEYDLETVTVSLFAIDSSGIASFDITVDGVPIELLSQSQYENTYTFIFQNDWILEQGEHSIIITVWDADNDRPGDSLSSSIEGIFEITSENIKQFVLLEIDHLKEEIQNSPDECWAKPARNRKSAMNNKLNELKDLISTDAFEEAYDKLLHDIKPKLTGLKTDENEEPWGNGVFNNPWVVCIDLQEEFRVTCNQILTDIDLLINNNANDVKFTGGNGGGIAGNFIGILLLTLFAVFGAVTIIFLLEKEKQKKAISGSYQKIGFGGKIKGTFRISF
ncbi:MAG: hypothetical protein HWN66_03065 [Candidatus Helarchaeota archaeon]|nr:hypothetical protein [Candidatus Helarchaeota archaeon]